MRLFGSFDMSSPIWVVFIGALFVLNVFHLFFKINFYTRMSAFNAVLQLFFRRLKPGCTNKAFLLLLRRLIIFIFLLNFHSILSYNFALIRQVRLVSFLASYIWLCFIIFTIFNNLKGLLSHCIPEGTPIYLTWFLFLIEILRNFIRPLTLTVRLVANILAGHLLMILLSELVFSYRFLKFLYLSLNLVEFFVSFIQAYIFVTMLALYYAEVD